MACSAAEMKTKNLNLWRKREKQNPKKNSEVTLSKKHPNKQKRRHWLHLIVRVRMTWELGRWIPRCSKLIIRHLSPHLRNLQCKVKKRKKQAICSEEMTMKKTLRKWISNRRLQPDPAGPTLLRLSLRRRWLGEMTAVMKKSPNPTWPVDLLLEYLLVERGSWLIQMMMTTMKTALTLTLESQRTKKWRLNSLQLHKLSLKTCLEEKKVAAQANRRSRSLLQSQWPPRNRNLRRRRLGTTMKATVAKINLKSLKLSQ